MSAYVLDNAKISKIVSYITGARAWHKYARQLEEMGYTSSQRDQLGNDLLAMNQDAVMQRYPGSDATNLPGPTNPEPYSYKSPACGMFEAYELLGSFIYQCSEGDVPETNELYQVVSDIRNAMAHSITRATIAGEYSR